MRWEQCLIQVRKCTSRHRHMSTQPCRAPRCRYMVGAALPRAYRHRLQVRLYSEILGVFRLLVGCWGGIPHRSQLSFVNFTNRDTHLTAHHREQHVEHAFRDGAR